MPMERWTFAPYFFYLGSTLALWNVGRSRLVFLSGISLGTLDLGIDVLYLKSGTTNLKSGTGGTPNTTRTLSSATVHASTRSSTYSRTTLQDIDSLQIYSGGLNFERYASPLDSSAHESKRMTLKAFRVSC